MVLGRNKTGDLQGVVENLFWLAHVKEHVRIIGQYRKIGSRPRNFAWVNPFWNFKPQNFAQVATVTWMVGSSNFWYQNDRINIVFHAMVSEFLISRLVARESEMNDFWRNFVERHQVTGSSIEVRSGDPWISQSQSSDWLLVFINEYFRWDPDPSRRGHTLRNPGQLMMIAVWRRRKTRARK